MNRMMFCSRTAGVEGEEAESARPGGFSTRRRNDEL